MKRNYGIPYMGSKNRIAKKIIDFLPSGETFVDLFGGGGAITDCANESNKWEHIIYNELNELPYKCFLKALRGEYENETRWISRQDFINLKDTDEYVACCFSFGNNFRNYMYNEKIEPYKRAYHYAVVLDNFQPLSELFDKCTVDYLKKSVEGETNKKQRRLKFTHALGKYIISLSKESEVRKTVCLTGTNCRNVSENIQCKERLDSLKKSVNVFETCVGNVLQNYEKKERLDELRQTVQLTGTNCRNVLQNQQRKKQLDSLKKEQVNNITFFNNDYRDVPIPNNAIIYCDIPYKSTGTYNKELFDYESFYIWCEEKQRQGYKVYISEYTMPEDRFECVKEINSRSRFSQTKNSHVVEKIFIPKL